MSSAKVAVTQPYFFPYLGYFLLIKKVDFFVFLTDVQFPRRGWVHRNRISSLQKPFQYFGIPIKKTHRDAQISEIKMDEGKWRSKLVAKLLHTYPLKTRKWAWPSMESCLNNPTNSLSEYVIRTIAQSCDLFNIRGVNFLCSSSFAQKGNYQDRIVHICQELGAAEYWNLPGGISLYDRNLFEKSKMELKILKPMDQRLLAFGLNSFSVLDALLLGKIDAMKAFLEDM